MLNDFMPLALHTLLENTQDLIFIKDMDLSYVGASPAFVRLAGFETHDELYHKKDSDIFNPRVAAGLAKSDEALMQSGVLSSSSIELLCDKDGRMRYTAFFKYAVRDQGGLTLWICGVAHDITARIELETAKERRAGMRQPYDAMLEADLTNDHIINAEGKKLSAAFRKIASTRYTSLIALIASELYHEPADAFKDCYCVSRLKDLFESGTQTFRRIVSIRSNAGEPFWTEINARLYRSTITHTLNLILLFRDLDKEAQDKQQIGRAHV